MSAAAEGSGPTTKATTTTDSSSSLKEQQKPAAALEEDDEFEDFPVDGIHPFPSSPLLLLLLLLQYKKDETSGANNVLTWHCPNRRLAAGRERSAAGAGGRDDASVGGELGRR